MPRVIPWNFKFLFGELQAIYFILFRWCGGADISVSTVQFQTGVPVCHWEHSTLEKELLHTFIMHNMNEDPTSRASPLASPVRAHWTAISPKAVINYCLYISLPHCSALGRWWGTLRNCCKEVDGCAFPGACDGMLMKLFPVLMCSVSFEIVWIHMTKVKESWNSAVVLDCLQRRWGHSYSSQCQTISQQRTLAKHEETQDLCT